MSVKLLFICFKLPSATVTLYFDVELSNDNLPGTEQKISPGDVTPDMTNSFPFSLNYYHLIHKFEFIKQIYVLI
jgi:hypothetical protein